MTTKLTQVGKNQLASQKVRVYETIFINGNERKNYLKGTNYQFSISNAATSCSVDLINPNGLFSPGGAAQIKRGDEICILEGMYNSDSNLELFSGFSGTVKSISIKNSGNENIISLQCLDWLSRLSEADIDYVNYGSKVLVANQRLRPHYLMLDSTGGNVHPVTLDEVTLGGGNVQQGVYLQNTITDSTQSWKQNSLVGTYAITNSGEWLPIVSNTSQALYFEMSDFGSSPSARAYGVSEGLAQVFDFPVEAIASKPIPEVQIVDSGATLSWLDVPSEILTQWDGFTTKFAEGQIILNNPIDAVHKAIHATYAYYNSGLYIEDIIEDVIKKEDAYGFALESGTFLRSTLSVETGNTVDTMTPNYVLDTHPDVYSYLQSPLSTTDDAFVLINEGNAFDTPTTTSYMQINNEVIGYNYKSGGALKELTRGSQGTTAQGHSSRDKVYQVYPPGQLWFTTYNNITDQMDSLGLYTVLDQFDSVSKVIAGGSSTTPTLDPVNVYYGNNSVNLGKNSPAVNVAVYVGFHDNLAILDMTGKNINMWVYVTDKTQLLPASGLVFGACSNDLLLTNYFYRAYPTSSLVNGWNKLTVDQNDATVGSPSITTIAGWALAIYTPNATDLITHGDIKISKYYEQTPLTTMFTVTGATPVKFVPRYGMLILDTPIATNSTVTFNLDYNFKTIQATGIQVNEIELFEKEYANRMEAINELRGYVAPNYCITSHGDKKIWAEYINQSLTPDYTLELKTSVEHLSSETAATRVKAYAENSAPSNLMTELPVKAVVSEIWTGADGVGGYERFTAPGKTFTNGQLKGYNLIDSDNHYYMIYDNYGTELVVSGMTHGGDYKIGKFYVGEVHDRSLSYLHAQDDYFVYDAGVGVIGEILTQYPDSPIVKVNGARLDSPAPVPMGPHEVILETRQDVITTETQSWDGSVTTDTNTTYKYLVRLPHTDIVPDIYALTENSPFKVTLDNDIFTYLVGMDGGGEKASIQFFSKEGGVGHADIRLNVLEPIVTLPTNAPHTNYQRGVWAVKNFPTYKKIPKALVKNYDNDNPAAISPSQTTGIRFVHQEWFVGTDEQGWIATWKTNIDNEQYVYAGNGRLDYFSLKDNVLIVDDASWETDRWVGYTISMPYNGIFDAGKNVATIKSNTRNTLTLNRKATPGNFRILTYGQERVNLNIRNNPYIMWLAAFFFKDKHDFVYNPQAVSDLIEGMTYNYDVPHNHPAENLFGKESNEFYSYKNAFFKLPENFEEAGADNKKLIGLYQIGYPGEVISYTGYTQVDQTEVKMDLLMAEGAENGAGLTAWANWALTGRLNNGEATQVYIRRPPKLKVRNTIYELTGVTRGELNTVPQIHTAWVEPGDIPLLATLNQKQVSLQKSYRVLSLGSTDYGVTIQNIGSAVYYVWHKPKNADGSQGLRDFFIDYSDNTFHIRKDLIPRGWDPETPDAVMASFKYAIRLAPIGSPQYLWDGRYNTAMQHLFLAEPLAGTEVVTIDLGSIVSIDAMDIQADYFSLPGQTNKQLLMVPHTNTYNILTSNDLTDWTYPCNKAKGFSLKSGAAFSLEHDDLPENFKARYVKLELVKAEKIEGTQPAWVISLSEFRIYGNTSIKSEATLIERLDTGTGTGSSGALADSSKAWTVNAWANKYLVDSYGQEFIIVSNTADTLTVSGTPNSGTYYIFNDKEGPTTVYDKDDLINSLHESIHKIKEQKGSRTKEDLDLETKAVLKELTKNNVRASVTVAFNPAVRVGQTVKLIDPKNGVSRNYFIESVSKSGFDKTLTLSYYS